MNDGGFAVIDFETTGLFPGGHDRVVEVAIVHVSRRGRVTGSWETLVNPQRDLGAQRIHGIRAADVLDAPSFADIAPHVASLLDGRVIVAHNATFDLGFLDAELRRAGRMPHTSRQSLCTMLLAREFLPGVGRTLADCCAACGIELSDAHQAVADARATAELLGVYLELHDGDGWTTLLDAALDAASADPVIASFEPAWFSRGDAGALLTGSHDFLSRLIDKMPEVAGPEEHHVYLALLDRCLLDRHFSEHERRQLVRTADSLGIGRITAQRLHSQYFADLVRLAWDDGELSTDEITDIAIVGRLLNIPADTLRNSLVSAPEATALRRADIPDLARPARLAPATAMVLTGDMSLPRDQWHTILVSHGHIPRPAITKSIGLLVAADPDSLSGKAKKARDYGIPIVGEDWLREQLGV